MNTTRLISTKVNFLIPLIGLLLILGLMYYPLSRSGTSHSAKASLSSAKTTKTTKTTKITEEDRAKIAKSYGNLPTYFTPNTGNLDKKVKYSAFGAGYGFYLTKEGVTYSFTRNTATKPSSSVKPGQPPVGSKKSLTKPEKTEAYALKVNFVGASPNTNITGEHEQEGKVNYLLGNDKTKWKTGVPTFSQVTYQDLYPGINLTYKGDNKKLKYEFTVSPGADYQKINLLYQGSDSLKLDKQGNLIITTPWGDLKDEKPVVYQLIKGKKVPTAASYQINNQTVSFAVPSYNKNYPLVIDPGLPTPLS